MSKLISFSGPYPLFDIDFWIPSKSSMPVPLTLPFLEGLYKCTIHYHKRTYCAENFADIMFSGVVDKCCNSKSTSKPCERSLVHLYDVFGKLVPCHHYNSTKSDKRVVSAINSTICARYVSDMYCGLTTSFKIYRPVLPSIKSQLYFYSFNTCYAHLSSYGPDDDRTVYLDMYIQDPITNCLHRVTMKYRCIYVKIPCDGPQVEIDAHKPYMRYIMVPCSSPNSVAIRCGRHQGDCRYSMLAMLNLPRFKMVNGVRIDYMSNSSSNIARKSLLPKAIIGHIFSFLATAKSVIRSTISAEVFRSKPSLEFGHTTNEEIRSHRSIIDSHMMQFKEAERMVNLHNSEIIKKISALRGLDCDRRLEIESDALTMFTAVKEYSQIDWSSISHKVLKPIPEFLLSQNALEEFRICADSPHRLREILTDKIIIHLDRSSDSISDITILEELD